MSMNFTNCPKCGKLMRAGFRTLCPSCHQEVENQYEKCWNYLRSHRQCTVEELSEATGVSQTQIMKFVREGRISIAEFENLSYKCEMCGTQIRTGHLCDSCRKRLMKDMHYMKEDEKRKAEMSKKEKDVVYLKDKLLKDKL